MENPLLAIPEVLEGVEARADAHGCLQLRQLRLYSGGWGKRLAQLVGWRADVKLQLDEGGTFCWNLINGRNTLDQIAAAFSERYDRPLEDSRRAVLQFTRDLMLRRLVQLVQPDPVS